MLLTNAIAVAWYYISIANFSQFMFVNETLPILILAAREDWWLSSVSSKSE
jgi:hypothetical protein